MPAYLWPLYEGAPVSQYFGADPGGYNPAGGHTGCDYAVPVGTPVRAEADGVITMAHQPGAYTTNQYWIEGAWAGLVVSLDCGPVVFHHAHLSQALVSVGQHVRQGDVIARTGNSGGATSGAHLHFEAMPDGWNLGSPTYGRVDPGLYCSGHWSETVTLQGNQRITAMTATMRAAPDATAAVLGTFEPDRILDFKGWVTGQDPYGDGRAVWFVGAYSGGYVWAGAFHDEGTHHLADLTPPPVQAPEVQAHQRVTAADGAIMRAGPDKNTHVVQAFGPDLILDLKGWVRGTDPYGDGRNVWFVGAHTGGYMWAGAFTDPATGTLPDLTDASRPHQTILAYQFALDFPEVNGIRVEKIPAHQGNVDVGNFPAHPERAVIHQMGVPGVDTITSTISEFTRAGSYKSAHFSVTGDRIVQHVSLKDRAYHAGAGGNGWYGIETDPVQDEATRANVRALLVLLRDRDARVPERIRHRDVPGAATLCGAVIDLDQYTVPAPAPAPQPDLPPPLDEAGTVRRFLDWLTDHLMKQFLNRPK